MRDPKLESAIETAKRLGTYNQIDRSLQYQGDYSPKALLRGIDALGCNQRKRDKTQFRRHLIVMAFAAVLARAPEIMAWVRALLK